MYGSGDGDVPLGSLVVDQDPVRGDKVGGVILPPFGAVKHPIPEFRERRREADVCKIGAVGESGIANARHPFGNVDAR